MIKAQDLVKLYVNCMILSDREYNQFWSSGKDKPKGYNLLSCRLLSNLILS